MRYQNYNTDLNLVVPLQDNGVFLGSLSGVTSFTVLISAGNNNGITVNYDGEDITAPSGVMAGVIGGSLHVYVNAQAVESSLGTGIVTADILINFYDDDYDDGIRTYSVTQSMMVMLVDGDIPEEGSQDVTPPSFGVLTLTMNGVTIGTYNGTSTTIEIPAYEGGTVLVDGDTIVSENNVLRVANGIKGASLEYDGAGHSINLAQGSYSYSAIIPYASPTNGGLVNTYVQTFSGRKNFNSGISIGDCVLTWDAASNSLILSNAATGEVVNLKMSGTIAQNFSAPVLQLLPLDESLSTDAETEVTTTIIVKAENIADDATINLSLTGDTTGFNVSPLSVTGAAAKSAQGAAVTFGFNPALIDQTAFMGDTVELWTVINASIVGGVSTSAGIQTTVNFNVS
jgi:hypothetical protein